MDFNTTTTGLASFLGLDQIALLAILSVFTLICRAVGKLIPDDKTGFLGFVRKACKVMGLYVQNRVVSEPESSVAKTLIEETQRVKNINDSLNGLPEEAFEQAENIFKRSKRTGKSNPPMGGE